MAAEKKPPKSEETPQELDRIRDIIFGSQMRTYENDFITIHNDLTRLQQELDTLNEKLVEQEREQKEKLLAHDREMRKANESLRNELRETARKLMNEKVDRQGLGDLFIELGNHLKTGGSLADTLKDVLAAKED